MSGVASGPELGAIESIRAGLPSSSGPSTVGFFFLFATVGLRAFGGAVGRGSGAAGSVWDNTSAGRAGAKGRKSIGSPSSCSATSRCTSAFFRTEGSASSTQASWAFTAPIVSGLTAVPARVSAPEIAFASSLTEPRFWKSRAHA